MDRCQCKNSFNNQKSKTVTPEPNGHTTGRFNHPNPEEVEENDFKCNFMSMMETFKEDMKTPLKKSIKRKTKNQ